MIGQPGTGKSSLVAEHIRDVTDSKLMLAEIVSGRLGADDVLRMIATRFGVEADGITKSTLLTHLEERFRNLLKQGRRPVLLVDEAQGLSPDALEEIRGLTNLQSGNAPLLQVVLVGQPSLLDLVRSPGLEQLHQRVIATCQLEPLLEEDVRGYVEHCLRLSGWEGNPGIDEDVYGRVHDESLGVPRRVNLICSRLLLRGMVRQSSRLTLDDVEAVLDDLRREGLLISADGSEAAATETDQ